MNNIVGSLNVTMQTWQLVLEAYTFCYENLQKSNIPVPAPEQVLSATRSMVSYILSHSPSFVRQLYGMISQMVIQSNFMGIFVSLVIMYTFYCLLTGAIKYFYRLIYGFVKFSLILLAVGTGVYFAHMYLSNSTSTTHSRTTKSYS